MLHCSQELRQRFVKAESALFRIRFETDAADERQRFLETLNFDWQPVRLASHEREVAMQELIPYFLQVSSSEKNALKTKLLEANPFLSKTFDGESYFRVHWTKVADLVAHRRVYLEKGQAYVPMSQQISLVLAEFQSRLDKQLEVGLKTASELCLEADFCLSSQRVLCQDWTKMTA